MMTRGTVWFIGVFGVVALTGGAVAWKARPIERRIEQSAASELKRRGLDRRIEALQLDVKGRDLTLAGTALSADDRKAALEAAAAAPGAGHVVAEIGLAPEIKPFVFRVVRNTDGGATLDGAAPGPEAAEKLSALGRSLFGGEITASLRMARGAPAGDWHAAATLAVEVIALVEQGDAVLSDNALSLRGRVRDDAALDAATAAFSRGLPDGFRGSHDLFTALDEDLRGGPLTTAGPCQALVDKVMAGQSIRFAPGTAALSEVKPRLLERLARATRRCGTLYLQIYAVSDIKAGDAAANLQLGEARARTLADALAE
ncbi:MAG: BON domain-containing protein, partial [Alphaproteobacteria bacterium]